jgi:hypothetical protein
MFVGVAQRRFVVPVLLVGVLLYAYFFFYPPTVVVAQSSNRSTIASPVSIEGTVRDGDIVSYNTQTSLYEAAQKKYDPNIFGVVVFDPVMYLELEATGPTAHPVVRFGEANVNVSTLHGEVTQGDLITSSRIPGVGARADRETSGQVLGFATAPMKYDENIAPMIVDGSEVRFGTVTVALGITAYAPEDTTDDTNMTSTSTGVGETTVIEQETKSIDSFKVFRYLLGSFVAIAAVVLALRRFGDLFAQSVISVGRNPLARSQIRSILVWNAVLIIAVSTIGLGLGIAIIVLP